MAVSNFPFSSEVVRDRRGELTEIDFSGDPIFRFGSPSSELRWILLAGDSPLLGDNTRYALCFPSVNPGSSSSTLSSNPLFFPVSVLSEKILLFGLKLTEKGFDSSS